MNILESFNEVIEIDGVDYTFLIVVYPDDICPADLTDDPEDIKKLASGEIVACGISVKVFDMSGNLDGEDSLWSCFLTPNQLKAGALEVVADSDMPVQALDDLRRKLKEICKANS